ncbi:phosphoenolpyruvate synthase [Nitrospira sp.]|nr:phosphoenolpyruvate synthase [Nitrospira sp.]
MARQSKVDCVEVWRAVREADPDQRSRYLVSVSGSILKAGLSRNIAEAVEEALIRLGLTTGQLWAVRSSATVEDGDTQSLAGQFETILGIRKEGIPAAIVKCWSSLWTSPGAVSRCQSDRSGGPPAMAVVLQPLLDPATAGVAFSRHPVFPGPFVVINAILGLAAPLVHGEVSPDEFTVQRTGSSEEWTIIERRIAPKTNMLRATSQGLLAQAVTETRATVPALTDTQIVNLAKVVTKVEDAVGYAVDVEWAIDDTGLWLLQARRMTTRPERLNNATSEWSRANFKETLPELPSPMGISFLEEYMEHNMLRHYRDLGCHVPEGISAVRVVHGRPFINVTLFQWLVSQLGADPASVTEQMGGYGTVPVDLPKRLPWRRLIRAVVMVLWKMRRARKDAPAWFREMQSLAEVPRGEVHLNEGIASLLAEYGVLEGRLRDRDATFWIAAGVAQGLDALGAILVRWFPSDWRDILNASVQGQGTVISARQIGWLVDLATQARAEQPVAEFFLAEPWCPERYRSALSGTRFLAEWERFLGAFGHRAIGESDIMTPRHADSPEMLLRVIRGHVQSGADWSSLEIVARQEAARTAALGRIRDQMRTWPGMWAIFRWWYRRLCQYVALREENRHNLMYFLVAVRRLALTIGTLLARKVCLTRPEDIFFLTVSEVRTLTSEPERDWRPIVLQRQEERRLNTTVSAPDFLSPISTERPSAASVQEEKALQGIPVSPGVAKGPACIVRDAMDLARIRHGGILVLPVIDPGLAPYFGLAAGVIAEMGGTLSHGAIIAREYGIPAVANAARAMQVLEDGEIIEVDGSAGVVRRMVP